MSRTVTGWKAFRGPDEEGRWDGKSLHFLFHGHGGSRLVPMDRWLHAKARRVRDGRGRWYRSGFHFLERVEDALAFDRLTKGKYVFFLVEARRTRPKPRSRAGIRLAQDIKVLSGTMMQ